MKALVEKIGKKRLIWICAALVIAVVAVIAVLLIVKGGEPKTITVSADESYAKVAQKEDLSFDELKKSLEGYSESKENNTTVFTKGNETVKVKTNQKGDITFMSYQNALSDDVQVKVRDFNESMIKIGDDEQAVLNMLGQQDYIYCLKTDYVKKQKMHIYYYGWTGTQAALELVFTDGKLSFYTIHSDTLAAKSDAPDVKDIK